MPRLYNLRIYAYLTILGNSLKVFLQTNHFSKLPKQNAKFLILFDKLLRRFALHRTCFRQPPATHDI